jgi:hypothetical protein
MGAELSLSLAQKVVAPRANVTADEITKGSGQRSCGCDSLQLDAWASVSFG